jgi:Arc/MetJ-type ribon-helix-helix transcriptional regulator
MSTMNFSFPDDLKAFVDAQVTQGGHGTNSEYPRELIRRDRDRQHLRDLPLAVRRRHLTQRPMPLISMPRALACANGSSRARG